MNEATRDDDIASLKMNTKPAFIWFAQRFGCFLVKIALYVDIRVNYDESKLNLIIAGCDVIITERSPIRRCSSMNSSRKLFRWFNLLMQINRFGHESKRKLLTHKQLNLRPTNVLKRSSSCLFAVINSINKLPLVIHPLVNTDKIFACQKSAINDFMIQETVN